MALKATLERTIDRVRAVFSERDALLKELQALEARNAAAAAERARALEQAQRDADAALEPVRRLERLRSESFALGVREERERASVINKLQEEGSRELQRFAVLLERLTERARRQPPPTPIESINSITGAVTVMNLDAIQKWLQVGPALARARIAVRDELWKLADVALSARIAQLRAELTEALAGTALENEIG